MNQEKKKYQIQNYAVHQDNQLTKHVITFSVNQSENKEFCICQLKKDQVALSACKNCSVKYHSCIILNKTSNMCIPCETKIMDPAFQVIKPVTEHFFPVKNIYQYDQEVCFEFKYQQISGTNYQMRCISTTLGPKSKGVQLSWPMQGEFSIDNCLLHQCKPLLKHSNLQFRREEFTVIPHQFIDKSNINIVSFKIPRLSKKIQEKYKVAYGLTYFFGIYIVKKLTVDDLHKKILSFPFKDKFHAQNKFFSGELQATKTKILMVDPMSADRIKIPIRGRDCIHSQCYCLYSFYSLNIQKRKWACPVCGLKVYLPIIDTFIAEILSKKEEWNDQKSYLTIQKSIDNNFSYSWELGTKHSEELLKASDQKIVQQKKVPQKSTYKIKQEENLDMISKKKVKIDSNQQPNLILIDEEIQIQQISRKKEKSATTLKTSIPPPSKPVPIISQKSDSGEVIVISSTKKSKKEEKQRFKSQQKEQGEPGIQSTSIKEMGIEHLRECFKRMKIQVGLKVTNSKSSKLPSDTLKNLFKIL